MKLPCWCESSKKVKELRQEIKKLQGMIQKLLEASADNNSQKRILATKIFGLQEEINKRDKAIEKLEAKAKEWKEEAGKLKEKINRPPCRYAIFFRPHPGGQPDEVDILGDEDISKVALAIPGLTANDLKCGWEVLLNANGNVVEVVKDFWPLGSEVILKERLSEELALVMANNETFQCFLSPDLKNSNLKSGDSLLNCGGLLVKVLPKSDEKEHFSDIEKLGKMDWSKVGGLSRSVKKIKRKLLPFKERDAYLHIFKGKDIERGMILHGPEGCGKTLCAKMIASDLASARGLNCYFMEIVGAELVNKYVGETSRKLRELFNRAKEMANDKNLVVIFIDEIDSLFRSRETSVHEPWMATDIGQFNGILQGMDPLGNILVIGATNRKDLLDKAILRPGRLGIDIYIPRPKSEKDVAEILKIYLTPDLPFAEKYKQEVYRYIDWFDDKKEKEVALNKDPLKIRDHFVDVMVKRLLYKGREVNIIFSDGEEKEDVRVDNFIQAETVTGDKKIYLGDQLSGAILESIVNGARSLAFERWGEIKEKTGKEPNGEITKKDFFRAIDEEFQRLKNNFKQSENKPIPGFTP